MKKTLLLGGEHTFEEFPNHLRALVSHALPKVNVLSIVYPPFETRGQLHECVAKFRDWLQNKVIDLEAAARTPSPTIDPSVSVVLIGHSMGGIVAAETLLSIARDQPVPSTTSSTPPPPSSSRNNTTHSSSGPSSARTSTANLNLNVPEQATRSSSAPPEKRTEPRPAADTDPTAFLFPRVQAVCAFDTPYLGIHPGVVAHGAETHYNTASTAYKAYTTASQFFGTGNGSSAQKAGAAKAALPAADGSTGGWGSWGKYAMFAGGAAAVAAAGSAAWMGRSQITEGWSWVGSHLEFVGCLARGAELAQRLEAVAKLGESHRVGFADFYTCLGADKQGKTYYSAQFLGEERTFCVVPKEAKEQTERGQSPSKKRKTASEDTVARHAKSKGTWVRCTNAKASSEISAHVAMFTPKDNPDYYAMSDRAKKFIDKWVDRQWYESSAEEQDAEQKKAAEECEAGAEREKNRGKEEAEAEAEEEAAKARAEVEAEVEAELEAET
ncbi:hypothetical protein MBLNU459_g2920t1 [Dothideomycetes sp. NU459]